MNWNPTFNTQDLCVSAHRQYDHCGRSENQQINSLFFIFLKGLAGMLKSEAAATHSDVDIKQINIKFSPAGEAATQVGGLVGSGRSISATGILTETCMVNGQATVENDPFFYAAYEAAPGQQNVITSAWGVQHKLPTNMTV